MPRQGELLAALSVAIDRGLGQPAEHVPAGRTVMVASRLVRRQIIHPAEVRSGLIET
jgi:hypothetical protein